MGFTQTHLLLCAALLGVACSSNLWMRSVPNSITVTLALSGLVAQAMGGGLRALGSAVLAAGVMGLLLTPFWARRIMSAGDVKLGVAAATWVGLTRSPDYLLASAVAGAVLATASCLASSSGVRKRMSPNVYRLRAPHGRTAAAAGDDGVTVPYGVAFAVGALFALQSAGVAPW